MLIDKKVASISLSAHHLNSGSVSKRSPTMKLHVLTLAAILSGFSTTVGVHAASCDDTSVFLCVEQGGALARKETLNSARADYCGNNRWRNQQCFKYVGSGINKTPIYIELDKPGANNQQVCWDALENIINREFLLLLFFSLADEWYVG
jgi:hypothetical protein